MCVPELSLVMPMYNVRQYVEDCLASIYAQPEAERIEVILVDDGSPDDSAAVAEAWLKINTGLNNWHIIKQENLGLGGARNTGLGACHAPYVWFIDTDDEIAPGALAIALSELTEQPDILAFCAKDSSTGEQQITRRKRTLSGKNYLREPYEQRPSFYVSACLQIWSTRLLVDNNLRFQEHLLHEDNEFTPRAIYYAENMREIPDAIYLIRPNPESITRKPNPQRSFHLLRVCENLFMFMRTKVSEQEIELQFCKEIGTLAQRALIYTRIMDRATRQKFLTTLRSINPKLLNTIATLGDNPAKVAVLFRIMPYSWALFIYIRLIRTFLDRKR